jgi:hypothetical protein
MLVKDTARVYATPTRRFSYAEEKSGAGFPLQSSSFVTAFLDISCGSLTNLQRLMENNKETKLFLILQNLRLKYRRLRESFLLGREAV